MIHVTVVDNELAAAMTTYLAHGRSRSPAAPRRPTSDLPHEAHPRPRSRVRGVPIGSPESASFPGC